MEPADTAGSKESSRQPGNGTSREGPCCWAKCAYWQVAEGNCAVVCLQDCCAEQAQSCSAHLLNKELCQQLSAASHVDMQLLVPCRYGDPARRVKPIARFREGERKVRRER